MTGNGLLVGDIGGTHARFALAAAGRPGPQVVLEAGAYAGYGRALDEALRRLGAPAVAKVRLAVAGPVEGDRVRMTNRDWCLDRAGVAHRTGARSVEFFNDVQAAALALPHLDERAMVPLGDAGMPDRSGTLALLMVGTGLGVSCLAPAGPGGRQALATEAGHAGLAATDDAEQGIVARLRRDAGRVSAETILSGGGLAVLYAAMNGGSCKAPGAIVADALAGAAPDAAALRQFCAFLGNVAGDLALSYGAWGGVAIGGGVPRRFADFLRTSPFRRRFEAKGPFADRLSRVPTVLVEADDLALRGLCRCAA